MLWANPTHLICPGRSTQTAQMRGQVCLSFGVKIQGQKRAQGGRLHLVRSVPLLIIWVRSSKEAAACALPIEGERRHCRRLPRLCPSL